MLGSPFAFQQHGKSGLWISDWLPHIATCADDLAVIRWDQMIASIHVPTERDADILRLVARGLTNQEIAGRLSISEKTVRNRLSLIFRHLHLKNRTQAAIYAMREGLADPDEADQE